MLSLDYFILEQIVAELAAEITGAAIAKIHQPAEDCLVLRLWNGRRNLKLLIRVGEGARLHLTEQNFTNPFHPPRFCQLLRARLRRLETIRLPTSDRIVELLFSGIDQDYRLICELIGARSNLYLVDAAGLLVDAFCKPQSVAGRQLLRGAPYRPLPQPPREELADSQLTPPADIVDAGQFETWLLTQVTPMSKIQAVQLKKAVELGGDIGEVFKEFQHAWCKQERHVALVNVSGKKQLVAYLPAGLEALETISGNLNQFLDYSQTSHDEGFVEIDERAGYRQIITGQIARLRKRQRNIATQQVQTESYAERRHLGDLLLANLHRVQKGMEEVAVLDWASDPPGTVIIRLQKELSPQENAEKLFKRYKKEKRGIDHVERRQQETRAEIEWLESLLLALDEISEASEVFEIGQELLAAGLISRPKGVPSRRYRPSETPRLNQTASPNGFRIFWGRNNRSNDYLSARMAAKDDLWFHAHNMPGCHLVLKRDGRKTDFAEEDIEYAAGIAAGYSRGKDAATVEVIVTEARNVSRPKGGRPGLVTLGEYRTLSVKPLRIAADEKASSD